MSAPRVKGQFLAGDSGNGKHKLVNYTFYPHFGVFKNIEML